jgi:hypothetical protein
MKKITDCLKNKPHVAISVPTVLCAIQFVMSVYGALRTGNFDASTMNQLLSTADAFESVVLFIIMISLKNHKK